VQPLDAVGENVTIFRNGSEVGKVLYIVGNGFDRHHGINSSYWDFRDYIGTTGIIDGFADQSDLWSDFEVNLSRFDINAYARTIVSENPPDVMSEHCERTISDARCAAEEELQRWMSKITGKIEDWVLSLRKPDPARMLRLCPDATYLSFNYTKTLEDLYGVDPNQILHIHGLAGETPLCIGHCGMKARDSELDDDGDGLSYVACEEACEVVFNSLSELRKPVSQLSLDVFSFCGSRKPFDAIVTLGFSFSEVDAPYVESVVRCLGNDVPWRVSCYSKEDRDRCFRCLEPLGVSRIVPIDLLALNTVFV